MCRGRRWDILGRLAGDQSPPHLLICRCVASLHSTCTKMCRTDIIPWIMFLDSDPISMGKCFVLPGFLLDCNPFWGHLTSYKTQQGKKHLRSPEIQVRRVVYILGFVFRSSSVMVTSFAVLYVFWSLQFLSFSHFYILLWTY